MKCKYEGTKAFEGKCMGTKECDPCVGYDKCDSYKPDGFTYADHLRKMTDEQLAKWIRENTKCFCDFCTKRKICGLPSGDAYCEKNILEYLRRPYEVQQNA